LDGLLQDVKYSVRVLGLSPGFTLVAALTLALGIGANASIFSLVNGLLLRSPAAIHAPERLIQIARSYETDPRWDNWSWPALGLIRDQAEAFTGVAGYTAQSFTLGTGADTERVLGEEVTGDYFEVLGVRPLVGRLLHPTDDVEPGAHRVTVLSHALWTRLYGGDPSVVGQTIPIGSAPYEIVGVAPEGFAGVEAIGTPPALWVPAMQNPGFHGDLPFAQWGWSWIQAFGRMKDGVTFDEALASMDVVTARLRDADPVNEQILIRLTQGVGLDPEGRREARTLAGILALVVGVVLLLTCTNVANLCLARAAGRRTEIGVRRALGAGRRRLIQQLMAESLVLAGFASLIAVPVVLSADRFLPMLFPYTLSVPVGADGRVLLFLAAVGIVAGLLFGAAPAWTAARSDVLGALKEGGTTGGRTRTRLRDVLVASQLALSVALVASAALLGRSLMNATSANPGFDPTGLAIGVLDIESTRRYDDETSLDLLDRVVRAVEQVPGVRHATVANSTPIVGGHARATMQPLGREDVELETEYNIVGPGYFETLGIPILRGRTLAGIHDEPVRVVAVNESLAKLFWPGEDPIGQQLAGNPPWTVVGVVGDVQMRSLRSPAQPGVYFPAEHASASMVLHARGQGGRTPDGEAIRAAVAGADPGIPLRISDLRQGVAASMGETRTIGYLVGAFALLALVLAAVGLYGLVSFGASERTREMGIRIALGARPQSLRRLILGRGLGIALLGIGAGVVFSLGLGHAIQGLLFDVAPHDPWALALASVVLLGTASVAAWMPARRAGRVDATVSLRD
jgi:predicted permease